MQNEKLQVAGAIFFVMIAVALNLRCTPYNYDSGSPGIITVSLKTISHNIPFQSASHLNGYFLSFPFIQSPQAALEAVESNGYFVPIYSDLQAFQREYISYNVLDVRAEDSTLVLGQGYAPVGNYTGINLNVIPGTIVILNANSPDSQSVTVNTPANVSSLLSFKRSFQVEESKTTTIILTLDLDSSLVKGYTNYFFEPKYYISSIINQ